MLKRNMSSLKTGDPNLFNGRTSKVVYDLSQVATWKISKDGNIIWSDQMYDLYDMKKGDGVTARDFKSKVYPPHYETFEVNIEDSINSMKPFFVEALVFIKGKYRWVKISGQPMANGDILGTTQLVDKYYQNCQDALEVLKTIETLTKIGCGPSTLDRIKAALEQRKDFGNVG